MRMQRCTAVLGALALVACGGGGLRLSPSYVAVHNTMAAMGLAQTGQLSEGSLAEGSVARFTTQLTGGECYTFVGFGGQGVADLDVLVFDAAGAEIASDGTQAAQAATKVCPPTSGDYQVAVRMSRGNGGYMITSWSGAPAGGAVTASAAGSGSCASPISLTVGTPVRGNTSQGGRVMTGSCIRGRAPEMVYTLAMEERAHVVVTLNSNFDGALYLLGTCNEMRSEIACNDDAPSTNRSRVEATLDPGTYVVVVDGWGEAAGEFELLVESAPLQSIAQVCGGALPLVAGQAVTGRTAAGSPSYFTATCAGGAASPEQVYALDVPTRSRLRVRMQSTHDGAVYVRRACEDPNSEIACNDDHRDQRHAMVVTTVDPGRYFIYVDGFGSNNAGDYSLRADLAPLTGGAAPADACTSPGSVNPGQDIEFDTFPASDDMAGSCGGQGAADVVYRIVVQNRVRLRARMLDSEFRGAMYLQRTCGQSSSEVMCVSARAPGATAQLDINLQPGTYFLVLDGVGQNDFGAARVEVQLDDLQALEQSCTQAPRLRPGRTVRGDTASSRDRFQASCAGGANSADVIYRLVVPRRSRVHITASQQYDGAIYLRRDCVDSTTEVACNDDAADNRHSEIDTVLDPGTYFVFIDGFGDRSQGAFTLDVELSRP